MTAPPPGDDMLSTELLTAVELRLEADWRALSRSLAQMAMLSSDAAFWRAQAIASDLLAWTRELPNESGVPRT